MLQEDVESDDNKLEPVDFFTMLYIHLLYGLNQVYILIHVKDKNA